MWVHYALALFVLVILVLLYMGCCCGPCKPYVAQPACSLVAEKVYQDYDYVIIGSGPAGCVLAYNLSAAGYQVALLEAGPAAPALKDPLLHDTINLTELILGDRESQAL